MNPDDLRALVISEIGNIAPEADVTSLREDDDFREALDMDSMDIFNLVLALSQRLKVNVPDADVPQLVTLGGAVAYLAGNLGR